MLAPEFQAIDQIRRRYQVFVREQISMLSTLLDGYVFASSEGVHSDDFRTFTDWIVEHPRSKRGSDSWVIAIEQLASSPVFEIPIFFEFLDEYQSTTKCIGSVSLTPRQRQFGKTARRFHFNVQTEIGLLPEPARLNAVTHQRIDGVFLMYYDKKGNKYYEQRLKDRASLVASIKKWYSVDAAQWVWVS